MRVSRVRFGLGLGLILLALSMPFDFTILPSVGHALLPLSSTMIQALGGLIAPDCSDCIWRPISDSHGLYLMAALMLTTGFGLSLIIPRAWMERSLPWMQAALLLYLSSQLGRYGMQKICLQQFYPPEANILHTRLGLLDKDILYWSTLGSSPLYSRFIGLLELIPALLLLHYRSRPIALAISTAILLHVFFVNLGFDIDVKLLSGLLFLISLYLLVPYFSHALSQDGSIRIACPRLLSARGGWLRYLAIMAVICELASPLFSIGRELPSRPTDLIGSYTVMDEYSPYSRLHIHSRGYLITEDRKGRMQDHRILVTPDGGSIYMIDNGESLTIKIDEGTIQTWHGQLKEDSLSIRTQRIDLDALPLQVDTMQWAIRKSDGLKTDLGRK